MDVGYYYGIMDLVKRAPQKFKEKIMKAWPVWRVPACTACVVSLSSVVALRQDPLWSIASCPVLD